MKNVTILNLIYTHPRYTRCRRVFAFSVLFGKEDMVALFNKLFNNVLGPTRPNYSTHSFEIICMKLVFLVSNSDDRIESIFVWFPLFSYTMIG